LVAPGVPAASAATLPAEAVARTPAKGNPEPTKAKTDDKDKPQPKVQSRHDEPGPFVDKVLDKALEVIKAKLAEEQKAKAA
jgi:hypothetical protein